MIYNYRILLVCLRGQLFHSVADVDLLLMNCYVLVIFIIC